MKKMKEEKLEKKLENKTRPSCLNSALAGAATSGIFAVVELSIKYLVNEFGYNVPYFPVYSPIVPTIASSLLGMIGLLADADMGGHGDISSVLTSYLAGNTAVCLPLLFYE